VWAVLCGPGPALENKELFGGKFHSFNKIKKLLKGNFIPSIKQRVLAGK